MEKAIPWADRANWLIVVRPSLFDNAVKGIVHMVTPGDPPPPPEPLKPSTASLYPGKLTREEFTLADGELIFRLDEFQKFDQLVVTFVNDPYAKDQAWVASIGFSVYFARLGVPVCPTNDQLCHYDYYSNGTWTHRVEPVSSLMECRLKLNPVCANILAATNNCQGYQGSHLGALYNGCGGGLWGTDFWCCKNF